MSDSVREPVAVMENGTEYGLPAKLVLSDGKEFYGYSFGYENSDSDKKDHLETTGEVVFSTSMLGYAEAVTDPNYSGQILVLTYPEIGNVGVPPQELDEYGLLKYFESSHTFLRGLVVSNYTDKPSHWLCVETFSEFLKRKKVVAIAGVDTRTLTKYLVTNGSTLGRIVIANKPCDLSPLTTSQLLNKECFYDPNTKGLGELLPKSSIKLYTFYPLNPEEGPSELNNSKRVVVSYQFNPNEVPNLLNHVKKLVIHRLYSNNITHSSHFYSSDKESKEVLLNKLDQLYNKLLFHEKEKKLESEMKLLLVLNVGAKNSILKSLLNNCPNNVRLLLVPHDFDFTEIEYDGLFITNGPGNPNNYTKLVESVKTCINKPYPIFGVCLGNLLLGMAAGYECVKMHRGNYGSNQPCIDLRTFKCYATSQSHHYTLVRNNSNKNLKRWSVLFENANDGTQEGLVNLDYPFFGVQFHPSSNPCHHYVSSGNGQSEWKRFDSETSFLYRDFYTCLLKRTLIPIHIRLMSTHVRYKRILLLSSGGLSIGQAGEFDYSGSQAIKALKESDAKIILINPNIATVQTSKGMAHVTYFLPITFEYVKQVIEKEKPDGIMCSFGGQTGLNVGIELYEKNVLQDNNCEILGTSINTIIETEDRFLFNKKMTEIGERCAPSKECKCVEECLEVANHLGYPVLVRGNFELGGFGSGFANNKDELTSIVTRLFKSNRGKTSTKEVCVHLDKSLKGWKEIEFEILRDGNDNCVCAASMENFDPLGVHTGDSIVVAPAQTLSLQECAHLRQVAFKVVRHLDLVGECNIQFAVNPSKFQYFIVELNARLSRSSALASKATGYPLAYVAAKIALGYDLVQMRNSITLSTTACFEPSLDYVVVKMPRWDLRKFENADERLGSSMKSVGEVMAIGRTFEETMQKALRMATENVLGFEPHTCSSMELEEVKKYLQNPTPDRVYVIYKAFEYGLLPKEVYSMTGIDEWFLNRLYKVYENSQKLSKMNLQDVTDEQFVNYKIQGFSDRQMASLLSSHKKGTEDERDYRKKMEEEVTSRRLSLGLTPKVKIIDTLAGEYPIVTNYCYLTYNSTENDVLPLNGCQGESPSPSPSASSQVTEKPTYTLRQKPSFSSTMLSKKFDETTPVSSVTVSKSPPSNDTIIVLGCGAYRIGSSIEFDWSAVGCIKTLRKLGYSAVIVNCNPETVSTDFDVSDRLYFEELSVETVEEIYKFENPSGIILSVGGQTANNLALKLDELGLNILGTPVSSIDMCESRDKFSKICDLLGIDQPSWEEFTCVETAKKFCAKVGFPVLARPSYVLSGASMKVILSDEDLESYLGTSAVVNRRHPVVISKFIENAKEVEMDCVARDGVIINYAISEHVEYAGVHSGDATLILPAQNIFVDTHRRVKKITQKLSKYLRISGPFNVQFMCKNNFIKVIECNLRASRTLPFISNTLNVDFIELATKVMVDVPVRVYNIQLMDLEYVAVKMPLFSFDRLYPADPMLGVEMKSTGEIAAFGANKYEALLKAMTASGMKIPEKGVIVSLGSRVNKFIFSKKIKGLLSLGLDVYATEGTYNYIKQIWDSEKEFMRTNSVTSDYSKYLGKGESLEIEERLGTRLDSDIFEEFDFEIKKVGEFRKIHKPTTPRTVTSISELSENVEENKEEEVFNLIAENKVDMLINVSGSINSLYTTPGYMMRRAFVDAKLSLITSTRLAILLIDSLMFRRSRVSKGKSFINVKSHQEYLSSSN